MKTKTRQSSILNSVHWYTTEVDTGAITNEGTGSPTEIHTKYETISYTNNFSQFNACMHYKWNFSYAGVPMTLYRRSITPDTIWDNTDNPNPQGDLRTGYGALALISSQIPDWDWGNFVQRGIEAMTPSLESGFSLANFIYEIREIKHLGIWWRKGRSVLRNLSGAALNYSFGVRPFLHDLQMLSKGLLSLRDHIRDLKAGAGKLQVRHYSEEGAQFNGYDITTDFAEYNWRTHGNILSPKYTVTMTYTYQFPELDSMLGKLGAFLDMVGLNLNPWIIWEALPYSFVVDWFFDVGNFLQQFSKKWVPITIFIKDIGCSVKWKATAYHEMMCNGKVPSDWASVGNGFLKFYRRFPFHADDRCFTISQQGDVTARKIVLGSLLMEQRIRLF